MAFPKEMRGFCPDCPPFCLVWFAVIIIHTFLLFTFNVYLLHLLHFLKSVFLTLVEDYISVKVWSS